MTTVLPTTPEIGRACDLLYASVGRLIEARRTLPPLWKYESGIEAVNLLILVARQVEAVVELARRDLVMVPAAYVVARSAFEAGVKAAWMVNSHDPFDREVRWLAHVEEEERFLARISKKTAEIGEDTSTLDSRLSALEGFRRAVASALPGEKKETHHNPNVEEMLRSLGVKHLHATYVRLSQYTHAGHNATWLYRRGVGHLKEIGEFVTPQHWGLALHVSWLALGPPATIVLNRLGGDPESFATAQQKDEMLQAIDRVISGTTGATSVAVEGQGADSGKAVN